MCWVFVVVEVEGGLGSECKDGNVRYSIGMLEFGWYWTSTP